MLDPLTLRVALAAVAATLLLLSYVNVYRVRRSRYSGSWCLALTASALSSALYMANGTSIQAVAEPLANAVAVAGAALTWSAARSLAGESVRWWQLGAAPLIALAASAAESPGANVWAGGEALLAGMALMFSFAAHDLWRLRVSRRTRSGELSVADRAVIALGVSVTILAALYWVRLAAFLTWGPDHPMFRLLVGSTTTTLALIVALVVATYTMTELTQVEQTLDLHMRATRDALTGLLNRQEFESRAARRLRTTGEPHVVVVADLDHFKSINDTHGHAAGDRALAAFATATRRTLSAGDLAGRLGGEEFALLLATADTDRARDRLSRLSRHYGDLALNGADAAPTVSYGIAVTDGSRDLGHALRRADAAMYRATRAGRDRAVVDGAA